MLAQQRTEKEVREMVKDTRERWSSAALNHELDVTDAATLQLQGAKDVTMAVGKKLPAPDGRVVLEWDGLVWWPARNQLLCIEAKTTVRGVHIEQLVERVQRMREYLEGAKAWVDEGRPNIETGEVGRVSNGYERTVDRLINALGQGTNLKEVQVRGVLGLLRSATGKLGREAVQQGLCIVAKPYGDLICHEG
jgi:hypothetical protein